MANQKGKQTQTKMPRAYYSRSGRKTAAKREMNDRYPLRGTASKLVENSIESKKPETRAEVKPLVKRERKLKNGLIPQRGNGSGARRNGLSTSEKMVLRAHIKGIVRTRIPNDNWLRKLINGIKMPLRERVTPENVREWIRNRDDIFTPKVMEILVQNVDRRVGNTAVNPVVRNSRSLERKPRGVNKTWRFRLRSRTVVASSGSSDGSLGVYVAGRRISRRTQAL